MKSFIFLMSMLLIGSTAASSPNDINANINERVTDNVTPSSASAQSSSNAVTRSPIMRAIEIIEFVSQFSNSEAESFGPKIHTALVEDEVMSDSPADTKSTTLTKKSDPLATLTSVAVYGAVKVTSIILSVVMYALSMLAPGLFTPIMSPKHNSGPLDYINYTIISNSIGSLPERSFELFDIKEEHCQNRAMCEIGQSVSRCFPQMRKWVLFVEHFLQRQEANVYTSSILRGLGYADCEAEYKQNCPHSPLKKYQQLFNTFTKLIY